MGTDWAVGVRGASGLMYRRLLGHHHSGVIAHTRGIRGPPIYIPPSPTVSLRDHQASSVLLLAFFFPTLHPKCQALAPSLSSWDSSMATITSGKGSDLTHQGLRQWNTSQTTHGIAWFRVSFSLLFPYSFKFFLYFLSLNLHILKLERTSLALENWLLIWYEGANVDVLPIDERIKNLKT